MSLENAIKHKARDFGFDLAGITTADPIAPEEIDYLKDWLSHGCAGTMHYMYNHFEKRTQPRELVQGAESVICVALHYKPPRVHCPTINGTHGRIANYALYPDYHPQMRQGLYKLAEFLQYITDDKTMRYKVCVDSVPLAERSLAQRAGLGFIGMNHMLIHPHLGSQLLLGELITTTRLEPDEPTPSLCNHCGRCVAVCPTGALDYEGHFYAYKCLSYLTTEHKGEIPDYLRGYLRQILFGCDTCMTACPIEEQAPISRHAAQGADLKRKWLSCQEILNCDEKTFYCRFANTAFARPGLEHLQKIARLCMEISSNTA